MRRPVLAGLCLSMFSIGQSAGAMELEEIWRMDVQRSPDGKFLRIRGVYPDGYSFVNPHWSRHGNNVSINPTTSWFSLSKRGTMHFDFDLPISKSLQTVTFGRRKKLVWMRPQEGINPVVDDLLKKGKEFHFDITAPIHVKIEFDGPFKPLLEHDEWAKWLQNIRKTLEYKLGNMTSNIANLVPLQTKFRMTAPIENAEKNVQIIEQSPYCLYNSLTQDCLQYGLSQSVLAFPKGADLKAVDIVITVIKDRDPDRDYFWNHEERPMRMNAR
jgi:hypothetical protein